jgi:hypothetical protein
MPCNSHQSFFRRSSLVLAMLTALPMQVAHATQNVFTLRVLSFSTFTDNGCNDPCVCIIDPIPQPIGGRLYLGMAPSIPEVSALAGPFRLTTLHPQPIVLDGHASYVTNFDPAILSRLTLSTTFGSRNWTIDSGYFTPTNPPFPTLILGLVSAQSDCTTLHLELETVETCVCDFDDGSGLGVPDGSVDVDDLLFFLRAFADGQVVADIGSVDGNGLPDQGVDINDLLEFLMHFELGC